MGVQIQPSLRYKDRRSAQKRSQTEAPSEDLGNPNLDCDHSGVAERREELGSGDLRETEFGTGEDSEVV